MPRKPFFILSMAFSMLLSLSHVSPASNQPNPSNAKCDYASLLGSQSQNNAVSLFFDNTCVRDSLKQTLSADILKKILSWSSSEGLGGGLEKSENLLRVQICKTKDCGSDKAVVFYDADNDLAQVLVMENGNSLWHAPGAPPKRVKLGKGGLCKDWKCWNDFFTNAQIGWNSHMFGPNDAPEAAYVRYIPNLETTVSSFPSAEKTARLVGDASLQGLRKYIEKGGKGVDGRIMDDPVMKSALDILLGERNSKALDKLFLGPASTGIDGDTIYYSSCRQHDCLFYFFIVYVNLKENSVYACWAEENYKRGKAMNFWLAAGKKPKKLGCINKLDPMGIYEILRK